MYIHDDSMFVIEEIDNLMKDDVKKELTIKPLINKKINGLLEGGLLEKDYYELCHANYVLNYVVNKYSISLPNVIVKKSDLHGNGVFANQNIKRGELVTFYPVHFLFKKGSGCIKKTLLCEELIEYLFENEEELSQDIILRYSLTGLKTNYVVGGYKNIYKNHLNGHIVNFNTNPNCYFQLIKSTIWGVVALKDIKKGTELLINYGSGYENKYIK